MFPSSRSICPPMEPAPPFWLYYPTCTLPFPLLLFTCYTYPPSSCVFIQPSSHTHAGDVLETHDGNDKVTSVTFKGPMNESRPNETSTTLSAQSAFIAAFNWRPPAKQTRQTTDKTTTSREESIIISSSIATGRYPTIRDPVENNNSTPQQQQKQQRNHHHQEQQEQQHHRSPSPNPYSAPTSRESSPELEEAPDLTFTSATNSSKSTKTPTRNTFLNKDMQFIYPDPETDDRAGMSASLTLERERQHTVRRLSMSRISLSPTGKTRDRDPRSLSPMLERDHCLLTPPSSAHNTMTSAETAAFNNDVWDDGQSIGADTMPSSTLSFEVLSKYERIPPEERIRQHQQTAIPPFRPNSELPFPVSSNLFRRFYNADRERERNNTTKQEDFRTALLNRSINNKSRSPHGNGGNEGCGSGIGEGRARSSSVLEVTSKSELDYFPDESEAGMTGSGCLPHSHRHTSASISEVDETSGIPSYTQEFNQNQRWRFGMELSLPFAWWWRWRTGTSCTDHNPDLAEPLPDQSALMSSGLSGGERSSKVSNGGLGVSGTSQSARRKVDDSLASAYAHEITSQFEQFLRWAKKPLCFALLVAVMGFLINSMLTGIVVPLICGNPAFSKSFPCMLGSANFNGGSGANNTFYADFPTLMNIESSFEKIVDGAAGGTALARVMKQSEMAVSDLSTVVKYSELKCRDTLSGKLDNFANDAKGSVRALSGWGSKVGGVLDQ